MTAVLIVLKSFQKARSDHGWSVNQIKHWSSPAPDVDPGEAFFSADVRTSPSDGTHYVSPTVNFGSRQSEKDSLQQKGDTENKFLTGHGRTWPVLTAKAGGYGFISWYGYSEKNGFLLVSLEKIQSLAQEIIWVKEQGVVGYFSVGSNPSSPKKHHGPLPQQMGGTLPHA